ncbi:sulfite exporter TauE/SafE family protein, partial [Delftia sp. BR1]
MFPLLLLAFGVLAGVTTVLFGFGGGFVAVPLLYALLTSIHGADSAIGQAAMHIAVATSTCVMIFGASMATLRQHRAGALPWDQVRPLAGFIAAGAVAGAAAATWISGDWVRWAFIAYLALTIADALLRPGFVHGTAAGMQPMGRRAA